MKLQTISELSEIRKETLEFLENSTGNESSDHMADIFRGTEITVYDKNKKKTIYLSIWKDIDDDDSQWRLILNLRYDDYSYTNYHTWYIAQGTNRDLLKALKRTGIVKLVRNTNRLIKESR